MSTDLSNPAAVLLVLTCCLAGCARVEESVSLPPGLEETRQAFLAQSVSPDELMATASAAPDTSELHTIPANETPEPTSSPLPVETAVESTPTTPLLASSAAVTETPTLAGTRVYTGIQGGVPGIGPAEVPPGRPAIYDGWSGDIDVSIQPPAYLADGRWAEVMVTLSNISITENIATGYTYIRRNPDGGTQYVTLFRADHKDVPQARIQDDAPLWRASVTFSDGTVRWFPVGCLYIEVWVADGYEPTGPTTGYDWHVEEPGGWFDCGNSHDKIPAQEFVTPGQSVSIPLYVYIQHPRDWEKKPPPSRTIVSIELSVVRWSDGMSLGVVGSWP